MKKLKVLLDFSRLGIGDKLVFYRNVLEKMSNNPHFPSPFISLNEATLVVNKFEAAILASVDGGRTAVSAMRDAEAAADAVFRALAGYVDLVADGNETIILSSGFNPCKQPVPHNKPVLEVVYGSVPGSFKLIGKAFSNTGAYSFQIGKVNSQTKEIEWEQVYLGTYASCSIDGLTIDEKYYFRVAAITADGMSAYCEPVSKVAV
jgi:hypothetical protein